MVSRILGFRRRYFSSIEEVFSLKIKREREKITVFIVKNMMCKQ